MNRDGLEFPCTIPFRCYSEYRVRLLLRTKLIFGKVKPAQGSQRRKVKPCVLGSCAVCYPQLGRGCLPPAEVGELGREPFAF